MTTATNCATQNIPPCVKSDRKFVDSCNHGIRTGTAYREGRFLCLGTVTGDDCGTVVLWNREGTVVSADDGPALRIDDGPVDRTDDGSSGRTDDGSVIRAGDGTVASTDDGAVLRAARRFFKSMVMVNLQSCLNHT